MSNDNIVTLRLSDTPPKRQTSPEDFYKYNWSRVRSLLLCKTWNDRNEPEWREVMYQVFLEKLLDIRPNDFSEKLQDDEPGISNKFERMFDEHTKFKIKDVLLSLNRESIECIHKQINVFLDRKENEDDKFGKVDFDYAIFEWSCIMNLYFNTVEWPQKIQKGYDKIEEKWGDDKERQKLEWKEYENKHKKKLQGAEYYVDFLKKNSVIEFMSENESPKDIIDRDIPRYGREIVEILYPSIFTEEETYKVLSSYIENKCGHFPKSTNLAYELRELLQYATGKKDKDGRPIYKARSEQEIKALAKDILRINEPKVRYIGEYENKLINNLNKISKHKIETHIKRICLFFWDTISQSPENLKKTVEDPMYNSSDDLSLKAPEVLLNIYEEKALMGLFSDSPECNFERKQIPLEMELIREDIVHHISKLSKKDLSHILEYYRISYEDLDTASSEYERVRRMKSDRKKNKVEPFLKSLTESLQKKYGYEIISMISRINIAIISELEIRDGNFK
jgi:hypothetical protein